MTSLTMIFICALFFFCCTIKASETQQNENFEISKELEIDYGLLSENNFKQFVKNSSDNKNDQNHNIKLKFIYESDYSIFFNIIKYILKIIYEIIKCILAITLCPIFAVFYLFIAIYMAIVGIEPFLRIVKFLML